MVDWERVITEAEREAVAVLDRGGPPRERVITVLRVALWEAARQIAAGSGKHDAVPIVRLAMELEGGCVPPPDQRNMPSDSNLEEPPGTA